MGVHPPDHPKAVHTGKLLLYLDLITGSPGTELGTGNRTVLEPKPAEPAIKTEPAEPEPISNSCTPNRNRSEPEPPFVPPERLQNHEHLLKNP